MMAKLKNNPFTSDQLFLSLKDIFRLLAGKKIKADGVEIELTLKKK